MNRLNLQKYLPHIAVLLTVAYFGSQMRPRSSPSAEFDYHNFGRIPVYHDGRYKPLDTVARMNLMVITHRQSYSDSDDMRGPFKLFPANYPATKWLLDVQTTPMPSDDEMLEICRNGEDNRRAWQHKVFRIDNDQMLALLNLQPRDGLRYSINEMIEAKKIDAFFKEHARVRKIDPKQHTLFDAKVNELAQHIQLYIRLSTHSEPFVIPDPEGSDKWKPFREGLEKFGDAANLPDGIDAESYATYRALLVAYDAGDKVTFNSTLARYLKKLESQGMLTKTNAEVFFNDAAPFYHCLVVYVMLALAGCVSWIMMTASAGWFEPMRKAAYWSMIAAFAVHTLAICMRMYLQGRPPVTNLYSSATFIGWGCVGICLIVEPLYRNGIAIVVGCVTGFCTLIIAHLLSLDGDTMVMLQAVLDTNFWLATHVTCITLGYTTAFVAGFMGIAYIGLGLFTDKLRGEGSANLTRMTYGVLCAGMFLSFVGTVLGGLWADYSWGRFWGWDPKENGALLIVIWIALILHARWGGMVKQRGIAVLSVLGIIVTSWSWFGTNFLGVGLHAYGGAKGAAMAALILIDLGFLAIAGVGCLPLEMWQSFRPATPNAGGPPAQPPIQSTGITAKATMAS